MRSYWFDQVADESRYPTALPVCLNGLVGKKAAKRCSESPPVRWSRSGGRFARLGPREVGRKTEGASGEVLSFGNESNATNNDGGVDNYLPMRDPLQ